MKKPSPHAGLISAEFVYYVLRDVMSMDVEEFWVLALGPAKALLKSKMIFRGTVDECLVHPREIFRFACLAGASSIVVAHNHPSGDPMASENDILFTRQLIRASKILEIPLIDHLIITENDYSSFANEGWCDFEA